MLGRGVAEVIREEGPEFPLSELAPHTMEADTFLVNLECAVSARALQFSGAEKPFYFRAAPEAAATLTSAGVDVVSLANNHALDADYAGLCDTLDILEESGIQVAGAGRNLAEASAPVRWSVGDVSFSLLSYCDHQPDFAATDTRPGIKYVDVRGGRPESLLNEVKAESRHVDHLIVAMHWQPNWAPKIRPNFRRLARRLVDAGARIVWGHSPHHFQGVEWMGDSLVLYATGDLVDDYAVDPIFRNDRQLLFEVAVGRGVEGVRALPIELNVGLTRPARPAARSWITERFRSMCAEVGSTAEPSGEWLNVKPIDAG